MQFLGHHGVRHSLTSFCELISPYLQDSFFRNETNFDRGKNIKKKSGDQRNYFRFFLKYKLDVLSFLFKVSLWLSGGTHL